MPITRTRTLYLSPDDDCHAALLATAAAAKVSLHILVYGFTLPDLADMAIQKHQEGLHVGVVVDKMQSARHRQKALLAHMAAAGVPVTVTTSNGHYMHLKILLVDHELGVHHNDAHVAYGSYNFTEPAQLQANSLLVDNDPALCAYVWERYEKARVYGQARYPQEHEEEPL